MLLTLLLLVAPAAADKADNAVILTKVTAEDVAAMLTEIGHRPDLRTDDVGDPLVAGHVGDLDYAILFYDCTPTGCGSIQYRAWFRTDEMITATALNEWNRSNRLGRAYLDNDGDPTIEHNVNLRGGVAPDHLRAERDWFLRAVTMFRDILNR